MERLETETGSNGTVQQKLIFLNEVECRVRQKLKMSLTFFV